MEIKSLKPRRGDGTLRLDDSDDLVVVEDLYALPKGGVLPVGDVMIENHAVILICTDGMAQFDYEGQTIQLRKNHLFIYMMLRSVISNFMSSQNFKCRQIWFTPGEAWGIDMHGRKSLADLIFLRQHPMMELTDQNAALLNDYFQLLCNRLRSPSPIAFSDIVRSLFSTMLLEIMAMTRNYMDQMEKTVNQENDAPGVHHRRLAERFMQLVEQSDGRIRKVDDFASQLNITPKYLSTLLKETLNYRPSEVIKIYTLKAIQYRLRFTDMTMQEIANDLHFANASFFGKYFKEQTGMTPLEYRKKFQE